jgi:adenylate cyclase
MQAVRPHTLHDQIESSGRHPMTTAKVKRKLTTILCADVQGYSSLMGADEADTLERLRRYRAIMAELFERHEGRKVNTWGDAVIAEFPSVVEAVRCGVEVQDALSAENRDLPDGRQMWFRIGINLGDVMEDGSDLYGDGVNVASRLQSLADAGGIMVSETVYNLTHKQLSFAYDFAGEQKVKGQDQPIAGYRVRMPDRNEPTATAELLDPVAFRADPIAPSPTAPTPDRSPVPTRRRGLVDGLIAKAHSARRWYLRQPRSIRLPVGMIALFATINLLTSGLSQIWFIYPSIPFAAYLVLRLFSGGWGKQEES